MSAVVILGKVTMLLIAAIVRLVESGEPMVS